MRRSIYSIALMLGAMLSLLVAAPASAATTGTLCGQVTAFTAATAATDGSITIDGTVEVIDSTAFGVIDAMTITTLMTVAAAEATTCVNITANASGEIIDLDIAAQAEICGNVTLDTMANIYSVGGVMLPMSLVSADADLEAFLAVAAAANADVCVDVTVDGTTGMFTTVSLNATLTVCGDATLDADSAALAGLDVPLSLLDAEAEAVLQLAIDAGADVCLAVVVANTTLVEANLSVSVDLCGDVSLDAQGNFVVDGIVIDADLLDADARALLMLAASADGTACAAVDAVSTNGDTSVGVTVTIEVCAAVTAITDGTITLDDVTFIFAGAADADIDVGDVLCVAAGTAPTGGTIIIDVDATDGDGGTPGATPGTGGAPLLPNTATDQPMSPIVLGWLLLLMAGGLGASAMRRSPASIR